MRTMMIAAALMLGGAAEPSPRAVVEASLAAINSHDAAALSALYGEFAEVYASDNCAPTVGAEAVRKSHQQLLQSMPDLTVEATDWVMEGNKVAILFTARSKSLPGGSMQLADFFVVRSGKIVRDVTIFNAGGACK